MKKNFMFFLGALTASLIVFSMLTGCSKPQTITMAWLPNNSGDNEKDMRAEFDKIITDATGLKVVDKLTTDYNIGIEAVNSGDAQIGYFGPFEYLTGHARNANIIPLVVESGNSGTKDDAHYYSRLLVKKGNESKYMSDGRYSIDNIAGKSISFVSTSSTSGFNMPSTAILANFHKQDKWSNLTKDDLMQGGADKLFDKVMFAGSHQLSLVNVLKGNSDVSAVDDIDVQNYLELISGTDETPGAVYEVRKDAESPFADLRGQQFVVIMAIPVFNTPIECNKAFLKPETIKKIVAALTADKVKDNQLIFRPVGSKAAGLFMQPHRFVAVDDAWYDPMRQILGIK